MLDYFDVVIIGASFSGLTLAHHLSKELKVLIVDAKPSAGFTVESTGLITEHTRQEFLSFFPIDQFITNRVTSIGVMAPNFTDYFISTTGTPWIYQTDTKALVQHLAELLPQRVTKMFSTSFVGLEKTHDQTIVKLTKGGKEIKVSTRFLVGADGGHSKVAKLSGLDQNKRFLIGFEQVFPGEVHLGPSPEETIYHFWFGEFSLGYGGWLSPTVLNGKKAFRIGLAKLQKDHKEVQSLTKKFLERLMEKKIISIDGPLDQPLYSFASMIPLGRYLRKISRDNILLIGDAAGFCGAFAADGIKGSVISGKEAALLIAEYLSGNTKALKQLHRKIDSHNHLLNYYKRQVRYRWIWDRMKSSRTFEAMYRVIEAEKESFLQQFCDSKDKRKSLTRIVLKIRHLRRLFWYSVCIALDLLK